MLRYVTAVDIPAGGQNNALSAEFYEPEEVLVWGGAWTCVYLTCVCYPGVSDVIEPQNINIFQS